MRGGTFLGAIVYAAVAALGLVPWLLATAPVLSGPWAAAFYCLVAAVGGAMVSASTWRRAFGAGFAALLLTAFAGALAPTAAVAAAGAALALAVVRSGILFRGRPLRTLVTEVLLTGGGLAFARLVYEPSVLGAALALWAFLLVQSLYFLVGGEERRETRADDLDPFEAARRRALEILDDPAR